MFGHSRHQHHEALSGLPASWGAEVDKEVARTGRPALVTRRLDASVEGVRRFKRRRRGLGGGQLVVTPAE